VTQPQEALHGEQHIAVVEEPRAAVGLFEENGSSGIGTG
jgi:hypothetical protein